LFTKSGQSANTKIKNAIFTPSGLPPIPRKSILIAVPVVGLFWLVQILPHRANAGATRTLVSHFISAVI
jgi:hypothetical protein